MAFVPPPPQWPVNSGRAYPGTTSNQGGRTTRAYSTPAAYSSSAYASNARHHDIDLNDASEIGPIAEDAAGSSQPLTTEHRSDQELQEDLLKRYGCSEEKLEKFDDQGKEVVSAKTGSKVVIKRILRSSTYAAFDVDREIEVLCATTDPSIPLLIESLELTEVLWTVKSHRPTQTVGQLVKLHGPLPDDVLKSAVNQLFSGIASLFMAGFAHLRICDQTVGFDIDRNLVIGDLKYACEYGKEKNDDQYAMTMEKHGEDLYVAPEVFTSESYNARKAVIWSCGILMYFMATGQTDRLSNIEHPSFGNVNQEAASPRRQSVGRRRLSSATSNVQNKYLIHYPEGRFNVPNYIRWILPRMILTDVRRRAELIEVATRVPKDYDSKETRPLMEIAWNDYKTHVGPMAGFDFSFDASSSNWNDSSSMFSRVSELSNMSNPFRSLLGSRRQSEPVSGWHTS